MQRGRESSGMKKTEDERNIQRENGRITQRAYRARRSPEKKEATRVANMERIRKGRQKSDGPLLIPAIGGHASGETVSAELLLISTSCGMASEVKIEMRPSSGEMAKRGGIKKDHGM